MSDIYEADVINNDGDLIDTLSVGGDDGSTPEIVMGPDTAEEDLTVLLNEEYAGQGYTLKNFRRRGATSI